MAKEGQMVSPPPAGRWSGLAAAPHCVGCCSCASTPARLLLLTTAAAHRPRLLARAPSDCLPACLQDAVKVMAKSLVRNRHAVNKLFQLKSQLQAVSLRIAVSGVHCCVCWGGALVAGLPAHSICCGCCHLRRREHHAAPWSTCCMPLELCGRC